MNDIQNVLLKLLKEADEICRDAQIPYFLEGTSAYAAVQTHAFPKDANDLSIQIFAKDVKAFSRGVAEAGRMNRYLESMQTNRHFPALRSTTATATQWISTPVPGGH